MGAVYRARDPRLSRDVAVKVIATDGAPSAERLRRFEDEARAVASLSHPNVLTVFDVGEQDGQPYVVFELLDGETLRERLRLGALPLRFAIEVGVQVCRGLQAAHARGILHRDLKPGNLFLTSDGFLKILDFGLAKLVRGDGGEASADRTRTEPGVVMGTIGYLSPEQARGLEADARSDIFAVGAILYETLSGKRAFAGATAADTISAILHGEPPPVATESGPLPAGLERIVRRCLAKEREDRFHSAHDLGLALEAVLDRPLAAAPEREEAEARSPYPGLSAFTEADAARFFGREDEVDALWAKVRARRLLAVIGPSGAGKTSFVRAGVVASRPEGWAAVVATPGTSPLVMLGQTLAPELAGDPQALRQLVRFEDPEAACEVLLRWRKAHAEALLVVDQFEELFTLNAPEAQARFAAFLGRLARDADIHVLLSLRDDFLMRCGEHEGLAPAFAELTPLLPMGRAALRRALLEPAKREGYRFEDETLVEEMADAVEGVRGALPLLAFAVARVWEARDQHRKLLTRAGYDEIGGVAGALAQHAEAAIDRVGPERQGTVREIFRNLVTAEGTRAAVDREELLSVFPERKDAEPVLRQLVEERLLTTYEVEGAEGEPSRHRVEVVHESLLGAWPRLVRWRAQDEDGAHLRDQLRQGAHLWQEKGRTSDLLWTGTAYQEFELWRARYPGALTAVEEHFAKAMAQCAARRRRRRRAIAGAIVAASLVVAAVTGVLWTRARGEALRAEAGKLLALARARLLDDPTGALAYARGSLDLFDTREGRTFVLEALWRGPVARILPLDQAARQLQLPQAQVGTDFVTMSPDGRWLAANSGPNHRVLLFPEDGGTPRALPLPPDTTANGVAFGPRSDLFVTGGPGHTLKLWSLPDLREVRTVPLGAGVWSVLGDVRGGKLFLFTRTPQGGVSQALQLPGADPRVVATHTPDESVRGVDPRGAEAAVVWDRTLGLRSLDGANRVRILGRTRDQILGLSYSPRGDLVASTDLTGETSILSTVEGARNPVRVLQGPEYAGSSATIFDPEGRRVSQVGPNGTQVLWDLEEVPDAKPLVIGRPGPSLYSNATWDPAGRWLVTSALAGPTLEFWPASSPRRRVLPGFGQSYSLAFTPDGRWLATCTVNKPARVWPLGARDGGARDLAPPEPCVSLSMHPTDGRVVVGTSNGKVLLYPIPAGPPRLLTDRFVPFPFSAFDRQGREVAVFPFGFQPIADPALRVVRVWDVSSGRERTYSVARVTEPDWFGFGTAGFAPEGLYVGARGGVRRLSLPAEPGGIVTSEAVYEAPLSTLNLSRDGTHLLVLGTRKALGGSSLFEEMLLLDLPGRTTRRITTHGARLSSAVLSPSGRVVVTGDADGVLRVGPTTGGEPHLLFGHKGRIVAVAVSPDERWIASSSDDSISIWPMPDVSRPPLHTLSRAELLAKLDALTNLRVVRDPTGSTGWTLGVGPFPGWKDVPMW